MIIDIDYIKTNSLNQSLTELASTNKNQVSKILLFVEKKIFLTVCKEQFMDKEGEYIFPEDLQQTVLYLIESYYLENVVEKEKELKSISLDDYKEEYVQESNVQDVSFIPLSFYGIPILKEYLDILDKYRCEEGMEMFGTFSLGW